MDRLEHGDLPLEASLAAFEEGVRLSRRCAAELDAAEQKIEILMREGGSWVARSLGPADEALADEGPGGPGTRGDGDGED